MQEDLQNKEQLGTPGDTEIPVKISSQDNAKPEWYQKLKKKSQK